MSYRKDRDEFVWIMASEGVPLPIVGHVLRQSIRYQHLQEAACNRGLTVAEDWTERRIEDNLAEVLSHYQMRPMFQGDPRGATVKIVVPSGKTNDWGNTGICVPTR